MADLKKLGKTSAGATTDSREVKIRPSTRGGAKTNADRKGVLIRLDPDDHKRLRRKALENDITVQDAVEGLIRDYIES